MRLAFFVAYETLFSKTPAGYGVPGVAIERPFIGRIRSTAISLLCLRKELFRTYVVLRLSIAAFQKRWSRQVVKYSLQFMKEGVRKRTRFFCRIFSDLWIAATSTKIFRLPGRIDAVLPRFVDSKSDRGRRNALEMDPSDRPIISKPMYCFIAYHQPFCSCQTLHSCDKASSLRLSSSRQRFRRSI